MYRHICYQSIACFEKYYKSPLWISRCLHPGRRKNLIRLKHERYLDTSALFCSANTPIFEKGRWGEGEMGRRGDGEMGRWGDGEMGKQYFLTEAPSASLAPSALVPMPNSLWP
ncbi:MAG: hypothetical protein WBA39_00840 [Rivularia sp. (in: cyanobacteria)]